MGCSYDAHKNPRLATVAATVIEFDDCSYQEYEDTLFLCKICNISCRRSVNKSKIKSKMPLEEFLRRQRSEDDSFSPDAIALPLPPPSAADFPPLAPRLAPKSPAPKLTKAEKVTQGKINALLASTPSPVKPDAKRRKASDPAAPAKAPALPVGKILERPVAVGPSGQPGSPLGATGPEPSPLPNVSPSASPDRAPSPVTPILAVAALQVAHSNTCRHDPNTCAICRVGITCCTCQIMYTAPGAKRMRCSACLHWACDLDDSDACCSCGFLWVPGARPPVPCDHDHEGVPDQGNSDGTSPCPPPPPALNSESADQVALRDAGNTPPMGTVKPATRLYGGAPSVGSTEDGADDDDDSSASAVGDDTVRPTAPPTPPPFPTSSADEIDAFANTRYDESRPTSVTAVREGDTSSHYGFENKDIEDLTWSSTPEPAEAVPGYKHSDWPDAILQCEDGDGYHFIKRGMADISKIADDLDTLMSGDTSWKTMFHAINDCFQFNSIRGSPEEFMCMLAGLAKAWNDDAECRPLEILTKVVNNASALGRVSSRLGTANTALAHVRNERNQARADRKILIDKFLKEQDNYKAAVATVERLRRQRNELKTALEDIRDAPDPLPQALADLQKSSDDVLNENRTLRDTVATLTNVNKDLTEQLADRNEIIAAYERENADLTRQLGDSDVLRVGMKGELDTAKAVIESIRKTMNAEKATFEKQLARASRSVSNAAPSSGDGSAYQKQLESQLAAATKQIAYLDKAYKDKSASLKDALASQATVSSNSKQSAPAPATSVPKSPKAASKGTPKKTSKDLPKWGFEPGTDQGSQPYWDHNNKFSEYITAMVSATVTTLPHIPLSSAIATAIGTVTKAGPPPSKSPAAANKNSAPMKFSGNSSLSSYKTSDGTLSQLTMAQMLASASSADSDAVKLRPTLDGLLKEAQAKPKPTWRALKTSKTLVTKPGAKGTRSSELHLRVPRCNATRALYNANGTRLLNMVIQFVNDMPDRKGRDALKKNALISAKWSARSNLLLRCAKPMDDELKESLEQAIRANVPPNAVDSDSAQEVEVLNRPPTTALKFMAVPRFNEDGTPTDSFDLLSDICANPLWEDVKFFSDPKFLSEAKGAASGLVVLTVVDDNQGNVGRKLMNTMVSFSGAMQPCRRWVDKQIHPMCLQCLIWGHGNYNCTSNMLRCKKCGEAHDYPNHEKFCETCQHGAGKICVPKCYNCQGNHFADSRDCIFYKHRTSREELAELYKQYHPSPASIRKNEEARKRNAPPKGWLRQQMEDVHNMGTNDENDDGFTKVSKGSKRTSVRFPSSAEVPVARIDAVPEDEEDSPLPLASDPLHRLERETYGKRTPGAPVGRSMGGDANRRLDPADSKDGKYIANVSPPTPHNEPLASNLSPEV
ncbi:hypothetical protein AX14_003110 [Amanita brunnescens Koide BX004]|nr:hypothetical protein AX14_003110 [Amanita brunnescens Koide BX004]